MITLLIFFIITYTILAVRRWEWAVMLMLAALPSYLIRFKIFGLPSTLLEVMILVSFATWLIQNYRTIIKNLKLKIKNCLKIKNYKLQINNYPFSTEIILWLIISWLALAISGFSNHALGIWKAYFFEPALVFIMIINLIAQGQNKKQSLKKILWPLVISAFYLSAIAVWQKATGLWVVEKFWPRVTGVFPYPNALGLYLGPLVLIMFGWLFYELKTKNKSTILFIFLSILLSILAIMFARSEGALVGIIAGLAMFGLLAGKKSRWVTIVVIIAAAVTILTYAPAKKYAIKKITLRDLSGEIRKQQWRETWQMLKSSPVKFVFGTGLANYQKAITPYHQEGIFYNFDNDPDFRRKIVLFDERYKSKYWQPVEIYLYPHNILLNFWTELGLAGALLFIWLIIKLYWLGIKTLRHNSQLTIHNSKTNRDTKYLLLGFLCSMAVIIIHGLVDVPYFKNDLAIIFWLLMALSALLSSPKFNLDTHNKNDH
jgi:O-antigen ligase